MVSMTSSREDLMHEKDEKDMCQKTKFKVNRIGSSEMNWINDMPTCPTFYPTMEEFEDPLTYLQSIAPVASKYGICKIVSPVSAAVPAGVVLTKEKSGFKFTTRVQPLKVAKWDSDDQIKYYLSGRKYSFHDYEQRANKLFFHKFSSAANLPAKFVEQEFWHEITSGKMDCVEYACDIEGSAFSASANDPLGTSNWNLQDISRLKSSTLRLLEAPIPGVSDPMLYIGMLFSMFAWHVEDHYLYSINYHHCGASKTWYGVPSHAASDFENVVREHVYDREILTHEGVDAAFDLLVGKTTMFCPNILSENGVPVYKAVQEPGEFVITFPQAYHAGFSHGFNCGEAVNFAMLDWFPFGAAACKRYENLSRLPILPHELLLCKEAMLLAKRELSSDDVTHWCLKVAFVRLIRFQHQVCWLLKKQDADIFYSLGCNNSVLCHVCNHWCYVAFATCQNHMHSVCMNHAMEMREHQCGGISAVFLRDDISKMEMVAQRFEQDQGILEECLRELPVLHDEYKGYVPYSEIMSGIRRKHVLPASVYESQKHVSIEATAIVCVKKEHDKHMGNLEHLEAHDFSVPVKRKILDVTISRRHMSPFKDFPLISSSGEKSEEDSDCEPFQVKRRCRVFSENRYSDKVMDCRQLKEALPETEIRILQNLNEKTFGYAEKNSELGQIDASKSPEVKASQGKEGSLKIRLKIKGPSLPDRIST